MMDPAYGVIFIREKDRYREMEIPYISVTLHDNSQKLNIENWWSFKKSEVELGQPEGLDQKMVYMSAGRFLQVSTNEKWHSIPFDTFYILRDDKILEITAGFGGELWFGQMVATLKFIN